MKFFYIIIAILILLLMITIHEFGHYLAGKILGFKIDEFSIGFGPALFSKKKKNGEIFSIRIFPLGGYCAFAGETDEENILAPEKKRKSGDGEVKVEKVEQSEITSENNSSVKEDKTSETAVVASKEKTSETAVITSKEKTSETAVVASKEETPDTENKGELKNFNDQPPWKRIIVLMAGGVFNILSAVLFTIIFIAAAGGSTPHVSNVYENAGQQYICNLEAGDIIKSVDGQKIDFYHSLNKALLNVKEGQTINMVVIRDGKEVNIQTQIRSYNPYTPEELAENPDIEYPVGMGVSLYYDRASVGEAFLYCVPYTAELSWQILKTFGQLIIGKIPLNQVSGPIGTVNQIADLGMQSWAYLLLLLPLIAANLGLFNLFPIPALDGSKVVFTIIEWIRGKPINQKVEGMIHMVGLIVLLGLVVVLDIVNLVMGFIK